MDRLRHILTVCAAGAAALLAAETARLRIRNGDPIWSEPAPVRVGKLAEKKIDDTYDQLEKMLLAGPSGARASGTNTLGEVPDSAWYTNRHGRRRMTMEALLRGPGASRPPADGEWTIQAAKSEGVTPGFVIRDSAGRGYLLKFDTPRAPNATTAADVIGSKIFYALGYYTPENYVVAFRREQLKVGPKAMVADITGAKRRMTDYDVDKLLQQVYRRQDGRYRGLASLYIAGEILGPWSYSGARSDDPNDIYPHENRRDLRGLYVFASWVNHYDATSLNTLDAVVEENGSRFVRHYLIDFGSILGSSAVGARNPRDGYVYQYDLGFAWKAALSLGLYAPKWQRAHYPDLPESGRFEADAFDPLDWKPIYQNPAFLSRLPDDEYWAAKQVMAFSDEEIARLVALGEYEDPRTADHLAAALIKRRDKIGRAMFARVAPLDNFTVEGGELKFEDLAVKYGFREPTPVTAEWSAYDSGVRLGQGMRLPAEFQGAQPGTIAVATLRSGGKSVEVYLRRTEGGWEVVGISRSW